MVDNAVARDRIPKHQILDIGFVRTKNNLEDERTKELQQAALRNALHTVRFAVKVDQCIVRPVTRQPS